MAHYEAQIAELEDKLARAEIVDASKFSGDTILSARSDEFIEPLRGLL
jgi:transcription elongation GreA/GreB family factor